MKVWGGYGERAEREPITGVWGRAPSGVQGQSPWWGVRKLKAFWLLDIQRSSKICTFWYFGLFNAYRLTISRV